jgi:molybdenum cofactor cytidylyltransferase
VARYVATIPDRKAISGIILAAGQSKRLGHPKQLLDICGQSVIRRVTQTAAQSQLTSVLVVLGHAFTEIERELDGLDVRVVHNPDFATGQATSLRVGLNELSAESDAVLFLLGDQPTLASSVIDALIDTCQASGAAIVQARYRDRPGHPVLFARPLFAELTAITGDQGARDVIRHHAAEVQYVDIDGDAPTDIDTEADYQLVLHQCRENQAK